MVSIAVTGGKGGTGKSTVAVNLAFALAGTGLKIDLVDLDVECPNDSRISGITVSPVSEVYKSIPVITDKCTGCSACVQACEPKALFILNNKAQLVPDICEGCMLCKEVCPFNAIDEGKKRVGHVSVGEVNAGTGKVRLIEGKLDIGEDASTSVILETLSHSNSDVKIIDTAAGTHCTVVKALKQVKHAFVVTEPTPFGLSDSKKLIEVLNKLNKSFDIVLNRSGVSEFKGGVEPRFEIPYSKDIVDSYVQGNPIVVDKPESDVSHVFLEMADYARNILFGD